MFWNFALVNKIRCKCAWVAKMGFTMMFTILVTAPLTNISLLAKLQEELFFKGFQDLLKRKIVEDYNNRERKN